MSLRHARRNRADNIARTRDHRHWTRLDPRDFAGIAKDAGPDYLTAFLGEQLIAEKAAVD
jgi:hypothetical protein